MNGNEGKTTKSASDLMDDVLNAVSETCGVTVQGLLTERSMPYPNCRGLAFYAFRQITGFTYKQIRDIIHEKGSNFTTAAISWATTRGIELISKTAYWNLQWQEIKKRLDIQQKDKSDNEPMVIEVRLPKEARKKIKIRVIEK